MTMSDTKTALHPQIQTILDELGNGTTDLENRCYNDFVTGNYDSVKTYRLSDLDNYYFRALSYLASAVTVSRSANLSNLPTILSEACEAVANYQKAQCLKRLGLRLTTNRL